MLHLDYVLELMSCAIGLHLRFYWIAHRLLIDCVWIAHGLLIDCLLTADICLVTAYAHAQMSTREGVRAHLQNQQKL